MSATAPAPQGQAGFDIHADQRGRIIGTSVAVFVLTDCFVGLRLLSRKLARAGYWWDDLLAVIAMIFSNILCIIWFCEIPNGYGRHIYIWPMLERIQKERHWRREFFVFELFFHTGITICKFSVLAFYYRIFPFRRFRNILLWVAALSLAYVVAIDVAILFQCRPLHYIWDLADPTMQGSCFNIHDFFIIKGIANVGINVIIFALPIPLLWRLRTTRMQQITLTAVFILAGFVVIVSIVWILVVPDMTQPDITWGSVDFGIWATVEPNVAVICACIPSLRPLVTVLRRDVFQHPLVQKTVRSTTTSGSFLKHKWGGGSKLLESDGRFSCLDEGSDLRPLGHGVEVRGGETTPREERDEGTGTRMRMENARRTGIEVRTDVVVETSKRLVYNDRLY